MLTGSVPRVLVALFTATLLGVASLRTLSPLILLIAGSAWTTAAYFAAVTRIDSRVRWPINVALLTLACVFAVGAAAAWEIETLADNWTGRVAAKEVATRNLLEKRFEQVRVNGVAAAEEAARRASVEHDTTLLFYSLESLQDSANVDGLAVFGSLGELIAWAGEHRAQIPEAVRFGKDRSAFVEQPLYSYLYFTAPIPGTSGYAVAALLLAKSVHGNIHEVDATGIADLIAHAGGIVQPGKGDAGSWQLVVGEDTMAHVVFRSEVQSEWRANVAGWARRNGMLLSLVVLVAIWLALVNAEVSSRARLAFVSTTPLLLPVVVDGRSAFGTLFSPGDFLLPLPIPISLGLLICILLSLGLFVAGSRPEQRVAGGIWGVGLAAVLIAVGYPAVLMIMAGGVGNDASSARASTLQLLLSGPKLWLVLQLATFLILALFTYCALGFTRSVPRMRVGWRPVLGFGTMLTAMVVSSGLLATAVILLAGNRQALATFLVIASLIPFTFGAMALSHDTDARKGLSRWFISGWLAAAAVTPYIWIAHVDARRQDAELKFAALQSKSDPYLEYLLLRFSEDALARAERGETGAQLLYRSWLSSGLAAAAYPVRLTLWSVAGVREVQLALGSPEAAELARDPATLDLLMSAFARARQNPNSVELMHVEVSPALNAALIVSIENRQILTVEVPPRRTFNQGGVPLLLSGRTDESARLHLVTANVHRAEIGWLRRSDGWRKEAVIRYADGFYRAHLEVPVPHPTVQLARGTLLIAYDLLIFGLLWLLARRAIAPDEKHYSHKWNEWTRSLRGRLTTALFLFFLIPTLLFGWVALKALSAEVVRATETVAENAVTRVAREFQHAGGDLRAVGSRSESDIWYFFQGELASSSAPEARELGIYGAWLPAQIYLAQRDSDGRSRVMHRTISGQQVVTAYLGIVGGSTLAVPMSLNASEIHVPQRELAHFVIFLTLIGGLLSLLLSLAVGRTLTKRVSRLQRAAARVGEGNLSVRLREQSAGEFRTLFESFNRMVAQLRDARAKEVRTSQLLAWGEMARQVAHEIKNPLTPIKLSIQHIRRAHKSERKDFPKILDESVDQILTEIDLLAEIASAFSRYGSFTDESVPLQDVDLARVAREAATLYRSGALGVQYRVEMEEGLGFVRARESELVEVIYNLLENAREALDGVGSIALIARSEGDTVTLAIIDDGVGIPPDQLLRIFDPQFSTRTSGTGLGLAIVKRLVDGWGALIHAESKLGEGTAMRITFRRSPSDPVPSHINDFSDGQVK